MTLFARGLEMLSRTAATAAGGSIRYDSGGAIVYLNNTIFGTTEFQIEDADGVRIEHSDMDFVFPAADLLVNSEPVLPRRGDRIIIVGREDEVYEVLAPGSEQVFRDTGPPGARIRRVHTKKLK